MSDFYPRGSQYGWVHGRAPCPAPTLAVDGFGDGFVSLSWAGGKAACGYAIFQGTAAGEEDFSAPVFTSDNTVTQATITGLDSTQEYFFVMKSLGCGGQGYGCPSNEVSILPVLPPVLSGYPCSTSIYLSWTPVNGATSYNLYKLAFGNYSFKYVLMMGTADPYIPYGGSETIISAETCFDYFDGNANATVTNLPVIVNDGTSITESQAGNFILYTVNGGGHAWPGSNPSFWPAGLGTITKNLDATGVVIDTAPGGNGTGDATYTRTTPNINGRKTILYTPSGAGPFPLIVALHPALTTTLQTELVFDAARMAENGFMVVLPSSVGTRWNVGRPGQETDTTDDVAWLDSLIATMIASYNVNSAEVSMIGMSNGGFMANLYAVYHADRLAAVVADVGTFYESKFTAIGGQSAPVSVTGTSDTITGLTNGIPVSYNVTAVTPYGETQPSNAVTVTPEALATPVVTGLENAGVETLSWASQSGVTYSIYQSATSGGEAPPAIATLTGTGGTLTYDVSPNYYYTVVAENACLATATSNEITPITPPVVYFATPTGTGSTQYGTINKFDSATSSLTVVHSQLVTEAPLCNATLVFGPSGALWGTNASKTFTCTTAGVYTQISTLTGNTNGGLILASDGNFYGQSYNGGTNGTGFIYKLTPAGAVTVLHNFTSSGATDAKQPYSRLLEASSGVLFGMSPNGGANALGSIYSINKDGSGFTKIHDFSSSSSDGSSPYGSLTELADGYLYGTAQGGGSGGNGCLFKISTDGTTFALVHSFSGTGTEGTAPQAGVTLGDDGYLYGTCSSGGDPGTPPVPVYGTVYRVKPDGTSFSVLHTFVSGASDGATPTAGRLVLGRNSILYGLTTNGGVSPQSNGTIYQVSSGVVSILHFLPSDGSEGTYPKGGLTIAP